MLSNEERELIEEIQKGNKIGIYELIRTFKREGIENFITVRRKYIDIIINLIEKQSKEIEELKNKNKKLKDKAKELIFEKQELTSALLDSTPDDKIKAKIEELENEKEKYFEKQVIQHEIEVLQSLLEKE